MKISGIKKIKLKIFKDSKGDLLKYISIKKSYFKKFGEVYFSEIKKNSIKGWNAHIKNTCLLAVPYGKVEFNFVDGRTKKINFKKKLKIIIGKENYFLIKVPPKIWFNFKSKSKFSLIANLMNYPHSKKDSQKKIIE